MIHMKGAPVILVAKSFFLFTPHPDPLPAKGRGNKRKELLAIVIIAEKSGLICYAGEGYRPGDIRGGISISCPGP